MKPTTRKVAIETNLFQRITYYLITFFKLIFTSVRWIIERFHPARQGLVPKPTDQLLLTPAHQLVSQIKAGSLKSESLIQAYINRIEEVNPLVNAVVDRRYDEALKDARDLDRLIEIELTKREPDQHLLSKPLLGLPVSIKDSILLKGYKCTAGSYYLRDYVAKEDADAVSRLKNAGAIPIVVTNVPEMLLWVDATNHIVGDTSNPYDLSRVAGGSSGGEAALISSCGSLIGVGSDLGGSLRLPALFCGIFSHKPSPSVVALKGLFPFDIRPGFERIGTFGPMCRYASDLRITLEGMSEPDPFQKLGFDKQVQLDKVKMFWNDYASRNPIVNRPDEELLRPMAKALAHFRNNFGCKTEKISFTHFSKSLRMWGAFLKTIESQNLSDLLGPNQTPVNVWAELFKSCFRASNNTFNILVMAIFLEKVGMKRGSPEVKQALEWLDEVREDFNKTIGDNVFIYPTFSCTAPKHNTTFFYSGDMVYPPIFNVLGVPVTQVTMGLSKSGLPVGFQVAAREGNDRLTIAVAEELEKAFGGWKCP